MTDTTVVTVCLALLIAWVIDKHFERRSVETRIAEDTCEEHAVFCCPWCFGAKDDDAPGLDARRAMPDEDFGTEATSGSCMLRLCKVGAESETADRARGDDAGGWRVRVRVHDGFSYTPTADAD